MPHDPVNPTSSDLHQRSLDRAHAWEVRAVLTTDVHARAAYLECAAELRRLCADHAPANATEGRGDLLYTEQELAISKLEAAASAARRRAHGTDLKAYQDAVRDVGYAYLKAHPLKKPRTCA